MSLTLQIVSQQARAMGASASFHFDEQGGTIGRVDGNNWILPDAERFVSSRHASVAYEAGGWYLTDISTNGTFVNDPGFLIGNGHTVPLTDGDRLYIGDYEVVVSIANPMATGPAQAAVMTGPQSSHSIPGVVTDPSIPGAGVSLDPMEAFMAPTDDPFAPQGGAAEPGWDNDPELDPLAAFATPDLSETAEPEEQWSSDAGAASDHVSPLDQHFTPPRAGSGEIPDDWIDETIMPMGQPRSAPSPVAPPAPAPPAAPPTQTAAPQPPVAPPLHTIPPQLPASPPLQTIPPSPPAQTMPPQTPTETGSGIYKSGTIDHTQQQPAMQIDEGTIEGLHRLLTAAGVDPARMPPQAANAVFQLAGSVFREVVQGLMEVLRARDELKSELRIARTVIQSAKNNPLKFSVSTDEALTKLLFPQEHGYMAPVEALHEAIDDIKAHQIAMMAGLSAALSSIMEQFDPEELERKFQKTLKHSPIAALRGKSKYWEMFEEYYQQLAGDSSSSILALYGEDFAKAYQDQIDKLS